MLKMYILSDSAVHFGDWSWGNTSIFLQGTYIRTFVSAWFWTGTSQGEISTFTKRRIQRPLHSDRLQYSCVNILVHVFWQRKHTFLSDVHPRWNRWVTGSVCEALELMLLNSDCSSKQCHHQFMGLHVLSSHVLQHPARQPVSFWLFWWLCKGVALQF